MSFGKSKSKSSSTQSQSGTSTTTIDPYSRAQREQQTAGLLGAVQNYTAKPYQSYTKPMVADLSGDQVKARELASSNVGNWGGILGDAEATTKGALGYDGTDVSAWMNPFEESVVAATGRDYDENTARQLNEYNDGVAMRGAFGNVSRDLGETDLRRRAVIDKADAQARLRYTGFNDARNAGFQSQQAQYQGAGILGNLATQKQQLGQNDVAMMEQLGASEREIEQAKLLADRAEFDKAAADELNKLMLELQARQGILSSIPYGQSTTSSGTGSSSGSSSNTSFSFAPQNWAFGPFSSGTG